MEIASRLVLCSSISIQVHAALEMVEEMCERGLTVSIGALHSILRASDESCDFNLVCCTILYTIYIYIYFLHLYCMTLIISLQTFSIEALHSTLHSSDGSCDIYLCAALFLSVILSSGCLYVIIV